MCAFVRVRMMFAAHGAGAADGDADERRRPTAIDAAAEIASIDAASRRLDRDRAGRDGVQPPVGVEVDGGEVDVVLSSPP